MDGLLLWLMYKLQYSLELVTNIKVVAALRSYSWRSMATIQVVRHNFPISFTYLDVVDSIPKTWQIFCPIILTKGVQSKVFHPNFSKNCSFHTICRVLHQILLFLPLESYGDSHPSFLPHPHKTHACALMSHLPQPLFTITPVSSALIVLWSFNVLGR